MMTKFAARLLCGAATAVAVAAVAPGAAHAQSAIGQEATLDIPAGSLANALAQFAAETKLQLLYSSDLVAGRTTQGVNGTMSVEAGLSRLLAGTGLSFRVNGGRAIQIEAAVADGGERVLGAVRVEGAQGYGLPGATSVNGINGSRDVTATEGTDSYTTGAMTIGSKTAASIKEVPASVSVLTNAQMQDQNITGIKSAMEKLPGVISQLGGDSAHPQFFSRGFQITTFQIDGGAGLRTVGGLYYGKDGGTYVPQMDMSLYDHVEIIRGAAGTFNGFGDPGGVINLVRKKPLDHLQLLAEGQLGSYDLHRVSVDLTGPIAFDGKLRGRLIATHQDNNFFYDVVHQDKNLISATLEFDASPTTLVSLGGSYDRQKGGVWKGGLMRYTNGQPLPVSRSTCLCLPWSHFDTKTAEGFAQIEQKLGSRWTFKYKVTYQKQIQDNVVPIIQDRVFYPDRNPSGAHLTWLEPPSHAQPRSWMQEATFDGSFRLFGQEQKIIVGGNIVLTDGKGAKTYYINAFANGTDTVDVNPLAFNSNDPAFANPGIYALATNSLFNTERLVGAYIKGDFTVLPKVHLLTGVNYSQSSYKMIYFFTCTALAVQEGWNECTTVGAPLVGEFLSANYSVKGRGNISWPPSVSLRYDIRNDLSAYVTYADIYVDQSSRLTRDLNPLKPITGGNFEGGVKWAPDDGRFNISLSGYYTRQRNFPTPDCHDSSEPANGRPECSNGSTGSYGSGVGASVLTECCYKDNPDAEKLSFGTDLEVSGQIRRNWHLAASYNFNKNVSRLPGDFDFATGERNPLLSYSPRHLFKLWTSYSFPENSSMRGLDLNFGAQGQSRTYFTGYYCPEPITGRVCPVNFVNVQYDDPGHVVFNLGGSYKLTPNVVLQINIENLLDKTYFAQLSGISTGNWYGAPRNFTVTLRGKW
jgi:outer-membrane receptor for ferric coprogen and ferric-rhodotorulic acid